MKDEKMISKIRFVAESRKTLVSNFVTTYILIRHFFPPSNFKRFLIHTLEALICQNFQELLKTSWGEIENLIGGPDPSIE